MNFLRQFYFIMNSQETLKYSKVIKYAQITETILMVYEINIAKCDKHGTDSPWFGKCHWLDLLLMFKPIAQEYLSQKKTKPFKTSSGKSTEPVKIMKESSNLIHTCYCFEDRNHAEEDCLVLPWSSNTTDDQTEDNRLKLKENIITNTRLKVVVFPVCCPLTVGAIEVRKILGIWTNDQLDITSYYFHPVPEIKPSDESLLDQ